MTTFRLHTLKLVIYCIQKIFIYSAFSYCRKLHFSLWYLAQLNQEVTIFSLNSMDGNGALFVNVLCDIQILRTRLICNFGWKHSYCLLILMFPNLHDFLMWNTKKFWRMFMLLIFHTMKVDGDQKVPCMHHKSSPNNLCVFWHYRKKFAICIQCYLYSITS